MKVKVPILDLHGEEHDRADYLIEKFITDNFDDLPVKIITGYSEFFINKTKEIAKRHRLICYKENYTNDGCWVVISSPWII
jgi:hypothetical protein